MLLGEMFGGVGGGVYGFLADELLVELVPLVQQHAKLAK